jgi:hypothetical protein
VGHVISVTKNTISGILIRVISADLHVEKFPTAWTEINPKSTVIGSTVDCPVCSSSVNWGAVMCRMFGMITLACLLTFSFSGYSKDQNCEHERAQRCGGKGKVCIPNCMQPCVRTGPGKRIEVPAFFVDSRGINL